MTAHVRAELVRRPLDAAGILREVADAGAGATVLFAGTVRNENEGRAVVGIEYAAYEAMAARELATIAREAAARFHASHVVVEHRLGALELGEASVMLAVAHARRAPAYEASRFLIEQLKRRVPIWKREAYADGSRAWVHAGTGAPVEVPR